MIRIEVFNHPFASQPPVIHQADSLGLWLLNYYGEAPAVRVQVFRGQAPCAASEITGDVAAILEGGESVYTVLESPAGIDPISWAYFAVAAVLAVVAVTLVPKPAMPSNVNRTQASPNNSLSDRNNQLRLLQRVEDIYGTVRAIPSLMMPTYIKYLNNQQFEFGYYCVSRGYIQVEDIRDAETLIADIPGASAAVYYPFTSPNSGDAPVVQIGDPILDAVVQARRAEEVDGITLKAPNQVNLPVSAVYDLVSNVGGDQIFQDVKEPNFNSVIDPGDEITLSMTPVVLDSGVVTASVSDASTYQSVGIGATAKVGWTISATGFVNAANNGVRTVLAIAADSFTVSGPALTVEGPSASAQFIFTSPDYSGTYTVSSVADGVIALSTNTWPVSIPNVTAGVNVVGGTEWTSWVTVPDPDRSQVWSNIIAAQGMYKDDGGGKTVTSVTFELQTEQLYPDTLNPTGNVDTVSGSLSGATSDEVADTLERVTPWTGPIRVRMRRVTPYDFGFGGTVIDEIKWRDLYSVTSVSKDDFGNKTTIHTVTRATERATSIRSRQLNCLATRLLPLYNGVSFTGAFDATGRLVDGNIYPTSQIADIIAAVSSDPKIGQRDLSTEVDMPQIYAVNQAVNAIHAEAGQFNYTFDSDSISFEETVVSIANAAFCIAYRQNGRIRLSLDRSQSASSALFTHRNKRPRSDAITRKFASDSEYDGVEFVYSDPDTETNETITLPLNGQYTKLKKFEIAGIRSFAQAWLRANREYYKLIGQRITLQFDATNEARALLPNSRIDVVDNTRFRSMDGEVVGQTGMELVLSRDVDFEEGQPHSLVLIRRDGSIESIAVQPGSDINRVVMQAIPSEAIVTNYGPDGVRTAFSLAPDSANGSLAYLVQEIDQSDPQYAQIRAINYSESYYQMDTQPIPPRDAIIN